MPVAVAAALALALFGTACPRRGGGPGGPGAPGKPEPGHARVSADGFELPPPSDLRPRPELVLDVAGEVDARRVVDALRKASREGFGTFRLRVAGSEAAGPPFGFEIVRPHDFAGAGAGADRAGAGGSATTTTKPGPLPGVVGSRTREDLMGLMRERVGALRGCWDRVLARRALPDAKVVLYLVIDAGGRVTATEVNETTLDDKELLECLLGRAKGLTFPPAAEETEVLFPLVFAAGTRAAHPIAVAIGGRTIAVTDASGEERSTHARAGVLSTDEVTRVLTEATRLAEPAPWADVLPRDGLRAATLDLALRLLEPVARELRVVVME